MQIVSSIKDALDKITIYIYTYINEYLPIILLICLLHYEIYIQLLYFLVTLKMCGKIKQT